MQTRIGIALALAVCAACASDLWYKKGAGTTALAQDKAACRAEVAELAGARASEAFEQCMSGRDWFHVATAGRRSAPAPKVRSTASAPARERKPTAPVAAPAVSLAQPAPAVTSSPAPAVTSSPAPALESTAPVPSEPPAELPPVAAAPETAVLEEEPPVEEIEEVELAPEPIDPKSRQFWIKFGAGPTQLAADQKSCRRELGMPEGETQPSRWGQSEDFDACMRGRGWGGGSIQAVPNR